MHAHADLHHLAALHILAKWFVANVQVQFGIAVGLCCSISCPCLRASIRCATATVDDTDKHAAFALYITIFCILSRSSLSLSFPHFLILFSLYAPSLPWPIFFFINIFQSLFLPFSRVSSFFVNIYFIIFFKISP